MLSQPRTSPPPSNGFLRACRLAGPWGLGVRVHMQPDDRPATRAARAVPRPSPSRVSLHPLPPPSWLPLFRVTVMNGHARLMAVYNWLEQPPFFLITDPVAVISCIISSQQPLAPLRLLWAIIAIILVEWERLDAGNSHYDLRVLRRRLVSGKHKQQVNAKRN